jgi:WD40 repeat protein
VRLWDTASWQQIMFAVGAGAEMRFSPDDSAIAYIQQGGLVGTLDLATSDEFQLLHVSPDVHREAWWLDVSPDSRLVAITHVDAVVIRDAAHGSVLATLPVQNCRAAIFEPDGRSLLTCGLDGMALWPLTISTRAGKESVTVGESRVLQTGEVFIEAALSDHGRWVAAAQKSSGSVEFHEIARPQNSFRLAKMERIESVSATPDMHWVAAGSWQGEDVMVWNVPERRLERDLPFDSSARVEFSPDGRFLAAGGSRYEVWQTGTWRTLYEVQRPDSENPLGRMAFSPDSQLLAIVEPSREIVLLEAATGKQVARLVAPHPAVIAKLRFSPDNAKLYALQSDNSLQVWDLNTMHRELAALNLDW